MVGGCDRERRPSVQYTRGQVFWKVEHAHSVGGEAVFNIPPSVALPRVSSLYFGAHGPHWSGVLTPGDLFRQKPLPNPRLLTRLFLPRDYTAPQKVDRASFSQFLFILATSPSGQEREKRIVFVWCSGQSIDGGEDRSAAAILGTVCDTLSVRSPLTSVHPLPPFSPFLRPRPVSLTIPTADTSLARRPRF